MKPHTRKASVFWVGTRQPGKGAIRQLVLTLLALANLVGSTLAQEVSILEPDLNAANREALQRPSGPLTEQHLLNLINLDPSQRNVNSINWLVLHSRLDRFDELDCVGSHHQCTGSAVSTDSAVTPTPQKFFRARYAP